MIRHRENHPTDSTSKLNWLRAAVLGANDGIVSVASIIVGVAAASEALGFILTAGIAGLVAGALSMAVGEYVSVSTQRDTERALLHKERIEIATDPRAEMSELASIYEKKGLSPATAQKVADELSAKDPLLAHAEAELHIDPKALTNPWLAAVASAASFTVGGVIPLIAIALPAATSRIPVTFAAVLVALIITGALSAQVGGANKMRATVRVVFGGILAMAITFAIGKIFGVVSV